VQKLLEAQNIFTKIVRNLDPQRRENLGGEIAAVTNALQEAAQLTQCIADAAQKAGIYNGQVYLTTPHLKMLLDDMAANSCAPKTMDMATPQDTAFKPSFSTPAVWTDELIAKRQAEFAAFQKTPEGIAEGQAFDAAYSEFEATRPRG